MQKEKKKRKLNLLVKSLLLLVVIMILMAVYLASTHSAEEIIQLSNELTRINQQANWVRSTIIMLIIVFWKPIIELIARVRPMTEENVTALKAMQWRVAIYLSLFELLVAQNMISELADILMS